MTQYPFPSYVDAAVTSLREILTFLKGSGFNHPSAPLPLHLIESSEALVAAYNMSAESGGLARWLYAMIRDIHTSEAFDEHVKALSPESGLRVPRLRGLVRALPDRAEIRREVVDAFLLVSGKAQKPDVDALSEWYGGASLFQEAVDDPVDLALAILQYAEQDAVHALTSTCEAFDWKGNFSASLIAALILDADHAIPSSREASSAGDTTFVPPQAEFALTRLLALGLTGRARQLVEASFRRPDLVRSAPHFRLLYLRTRAATRGEDPVSRDYKPLLRQKLANERFHDEYRQSPARALSSMIRDSLTNELADTALGIASVAKSYLPRASPPEQRLLAGAIAEALVTDGQMDKIDELFSHYAGVPLVSEALFSVFSDRQSGEDCEWQYAVTPKGRLNTYYLNRKLPHCRSVIETLFALKPELFVKNPQNYLLMANVFRGSAKYTHFVNMFLSAYGQSRLEMQDFTNSNVLARMKFSAAAPASSAEMVSVIMAVRNSQQTIGYSLQSVLSQSHSNLEVLICDDGSDDQTLNTVKEIARHDCRVRVFRSATAQGPYNIRNGLIEKASGSLVTFQDGDDASLPSRLQIQVDHLKSNPMAWGVGGRWVRMTEDGIFVFFTDSFALRQSTVSFMYRKEVFEQLGNFDRVKFGADSEYIERIRAVDGDAALGMLAKPLIFGLWSARSLTKSRGTEIDETGYRAPARRHYAEQRMRERLAGEWKGSSERYVNYIAPAEIVAI